MPALASMLGLPPAPVISPLLLTTRLSKEEVGAATAAFHRTRGHHAALDFARFRDSILREAFAAMPTLLMRRIFAVWSYLENDEMSLKEFLVGVMIVTKGSRDEHLRFVFQLMDTSGSQELDKRDTLAYLNAVASRNGRVVALERVKLANEQSESDRTWTVEALADLLHSPAASGAAALTPGKFVKILSSKSFQTLHLLDWIPVFATQFQSHSSRPQSPPSAQPSSPSQESTRAAATSSKNGPTALNNAPASSTPSIIAPLELSAASLAAIRTECLSLLDFLVSTGEDLTSGTFAQRFARIVPADVLETIKHVEALYPTATRSLGQAASTSSNSGRARFQQLVLSLLSAFALSADDVERLLFALFDEHSRSHLDVLQLATYLRFASPCMTFAESERVAFAIVEQLRERSLDQALSSPTAATALASAGHDALSNGAAPSASFSAFHALFQHPMPPLDQTTELLTHLDVEICHLLFHLEHSTRNNALSAMSGLKQLTTQLRLAQAHDGVTAATAATASQCKPFCLMDRAKWNAILAHVCDAAADASAVDGTGTDADVDDAHHALANDVCVAAVSDSLTQCDRGVEMADASERRVDEVVLVPLPLWLTLTFWQHRKCDVQRTPAAQDWRAWTTRVCFTGSMDSDSDNRATAAPSRALAFQGFCVRVSLTVLNELNGLQAVPTPLVVVAIASERCSVQDLVDAVELQRRLTNASTSSHTRCQPSIRECHLQLCSHASASTEHQALEIPVEWLAMPLKLLLPMVRLHDEPLGSVQTINLQVSVVQTRETVASVHAAAPLKSPAHRAQRPAAASVSSIHGLANLGNTCFMNSALQCLVATPLLREYFATHEFLYDLGARYAMHSESPGATSSSHESSRDKSQSALSSLSHSCLLPLAFGQLVSEMRAFSSTGALSGVCDAISPKRMQKAIAALFPHLSDGSQQDAQEFLASLLSSLSDELQRVPIPESRVSVAPTPLDRERQDSGSSDILSPQSRAFLSRLPTITRARPESIGSTSSSESLASNTDAQSLRFAPRDSNGRPDAAVANEWWIAHLIREPSLITALFTGQFKSVLTCSVCGAASTRFEPFSSLQLPISTDTSARAASEHILSHERQLDVVVVVHFAQSRGASQTRSLRLAVRVGDDWTLEHLVAKLRREHAAFGLEHARPYVACVIDGCRIVDVVDQDALLMTLMSPLDLFELEDRAPHQRSDIDERDSSLDALEQSLERARCVFDVGDELLVWTPTDRFVKGAVTLVRPLSPHAASASYDVVLQEGLSAGRSMRAVSRVQSLEGLRDRVVLLRLVHRRHVLVPFYCRSPQRSTLCGAPSVISARASTLTGKALYRMVAERFVPLHTQRTFKKGYATGAAAAFVIRRVRDDGSCCERCHWSTQCLGCIVPKASAVISDFAMDETLAIDWDVDHLGTSADADDAADLEWLLTHGMLQSTHDHSSYAQYRQTNARALEQSLKLFCSTESVEATCASCERLAPSSGATGASSPPHVTRPPVLSPHTKALSLWSVPPVLILQLKRFELAPGTYAWRKVHDAVDFPVDALDLAPFLGTDECGRSVRPVHDDDDEEDDATSNKLTRAAAFLHTQLSVPLDSASRDVTAYSLYGVVNHVGDIGSGHYTAHIRHPESSDEWWLVDDAVGLPIDIQRFTPSAAVYLLFYVRHDVLPVRARRASGANAGATSPLRPEDAASLELERMRLASLFPRQARAVKLSEAAMHCAWESEGQRATTAAKRGAGASATPSRGSSTTGEKHSDACKFM